MYEVTNKYLNDIVDVYRVIGKWRHRQYAQRSIIFFLENNLMKGLNLSADSQKRCLIGLVLKDDNDINDGQKQEIITNYLKYINHY